MDGNRLREAFQRIESLDERLTYRIRPRSMVSIVSPTADQVDDRLRELAGYTIELKEIMRDFMLAFAKPRKQDE
ncbi:MAG: hypothetical protein GY719_24500 [bacterium]|nr:hypothetical protein [bacterium]